ncbi:DUF4870 domain-containing protein [Anoxynatronum buryatiense]|uniref:Uncharacterized conserved protein, Tic20 family n=1 Tax=Anoxynatronum buryatiense TaxID=489973 RepID=A0AA45WVN9_9CLOT|nr:DUF4870 domain-containing protein [Anoxynatronum buryatiense]SMP54162.1 Uncharacterized conserved protein, Tic20 family [Anoxynatronum buryatiense]
MVNYEERYQQQENQENQHHQHPQQNQPVYRQDYQQHQEYRGEQPGRGLAMIAHLLGLVTGFLVPLIIYLLVDQSKPFAKRHAAEALNFQITLMIAFFVSGILSLILIGILGFIIFGLLDLICSIIATMKASNNEDYRYPLTIRFIRE